MMVDSIQDIHTIKNTFEQNSVLHFTYEIGTGNTLNFLDVRVDAGGNNIVTSVFKKATNAEVYLNAESECPQRYKDGMINGLIHRTFKISSSWQHFHSSIQTLKQALVNIGYAGLSFDRILNKYLANRENKSSDSDPVVHKVYYRNQYSSAYKADERVIKDIVKKNTKCINEKERLNLVIYYKSKTINFLVMKNNQTPQAICTKKYQRHIRVYLYPGRLCTPKILVYRRNNYHSF